jgi:hypothetical protein
VVSSVSHLAPSRDFQQCSQPHWTRTSAGGCAVDATRCPKNQLIRPIRIASAASASLAAISTSSLSRSRGNQELRTGQDEEITRRDLEVLESAPAETNMAS